MKKLDLVQGGGKTVKVQNGALNYIDTSDLKNYLSACGKFLSDDGKAVVNYLISHPDYVVELGGKNNTDGNALAKFIKRNSPHNDEEKELLKHCNAIVDDYRELEIPTFQTKKQFDDIVNGNVLPDIIFFLTTKESTNHIDRIYERVFNYVLKSWRAEWNKNISNDTRQELHDAGMEYFVKAMQDYGKKSNKDTTFFTFARTYVHFGIVEYLRNESRLVRVPVNVQKDEKKKTGKVSSEKNVSGDKHIGDEENSKSVFDMIGAYDNSAESSLNKSEMERLLDKMYEVIEKKFPDDNIDKNICYDYYGVHGHKKKSNTELAKEYNTVPADISRRCKKIINYVRTNKAIMKLINELLTMQEESRQMTDDFLHTYTLNENNYENDFDNMLYKVDKWFELNEKSCICDILLKSIFEMDNEAECRKSINTILENTDALSKRYSTAIKSFVNFVNDNIDENANIDYADSIIKITKFIGKDKILKLATPVKEDAINPKDSMILLVSSTNNEDRSLAILIKYYINHFDSIDDDREEFSSTDIQKQIVNGYEKVYGKKPETPFEGFKEMCKLVIDNNIEIK